jgi:hypothetical protein
MAAVMTTPRSLPRYPVEEDFRPAHLTLVPMPQAGLGRPPQGVSAATYWRRRLAVLLGVAIVVLAAGRAGAALGSSPLAAPGRPPSVVRHFVEPGDTPWDIAREVAPNGDPRPIVDELLAARDGRPLQVGETVSVHP